MSALEREAIPILSPLIMDQPGAQIDSRGQLILSTWTAKCSMILDCVHGHGRFYESVDTGHLFREKTPPASTFGVWIGRCSTFLGWTEGETMRGIDLMSRRPKKGNVLTMVFGHLVVQILAVRRTPAQHLKPILDFRLDAVPGAWDVAQVWPLDLRPIAWPPTNFSFSSADAELHSFAQRFIISRA
jgi:hypothetical protein